MTKSITGPDAGQRGPLIIHTVCNGIALPHFMIPAGATGNESQIYSGISTPASCTVTETADVAPSAVSAVVSGSPQTTTIASGGAGAATITDPCGSARGSLLVTKSIAGPLAGHQGRVTIHVACNGIPLSPDFVIAARTRRGSVSHSFDGIPAGSVCTVTETADGTTATVTATVAGDGQKVTVPAGKVIPVNLIDVYEGTSGSLNVIKTIAGPAAREHGRIAIVVACGGPLNAFAFLIRAHTVAGSFSRYVDGLPSGSRCTVTEIAVGRTATEKEGDHPRQSQCHRSYQRHLLPRQSARLGADGATFSVLDELIDIGR